MINYLLFFLEVIDMYKLEIVEEIDEFKYYI